MSRRPHATRQGSLALVLITTAGGLAGCAPDAPDAADLPVEVARAEYVAVDDCVRDWGSEGDCEASFNPEAMDGQAAAGSQAASGNTSNSYRSGGGGSTLRWLGPYFSRSGTVYRYDGRIEQLRQLPPGVAHARVQQLSPRQIYAAPSGRYATTAAHADAAPVKPGATARGRGGFGGTGRMMSSAGG